MTRLALSLLCLLIPSPPIAEPYGESCREHE